MARLTNRTASGGVFCYRMSPQFLDLYGSPVFEDVKLVPMVFAIQKYWALVGGLGEIVEMLFSRIVLLVSFAESFNITVEANEERCS